MERQKELDPNGKVVIVTGGSRGVGRQTALEFARRGAKVVLAARTLQRDPTQPGSLGEALRSIEANEGEALLVQTDLAKYGDLQRLPGLRGLKSLSTSLTMSGCTNST
jgi:NAD(P)-dependent dehydrogenase (short-subunit alcohol dehydrogenase family)